jgi:3-oxoadipate enol-lactonase
MSTPVTGTATTDDGCRLNYRIDGSTNARTLVLHNPIGTTMAMWDAQVEPFARHVRIVRYDARGHGTSDVPPGPYTIGRLGADTLAVLDAVGAQRAAFCGVSLGGMVGMWLGVNAGERLDRLILANTAAMMPAQGWRDRIAKVNEFGMSSIADAVIERWFTAGFRASDAATITRVRAMLEGTPAAGYAACGAAIRDMDQRDAIASIQVPTLVISGLHDPSTPPADSAAIAARIPGALLKDIDAAHLSNIEQPAEFTALVLSFLSGVPA